MAYVDRPVSPSSRASAGRIQRRDARIAFALELAPAPVFALCYGAALVLGDGIAAGALAAAGLAGLIASGIGWLYVREPRIALVVFLARLALIAAAALIAIDLSFTAPGMLIAAIGALFTLSSPAVSAVALAIRCWPRTTLG